MPSEVLPSEVLPSEVLPSEVLLLLIKVYQLVSLRARLFSNFFSPLSVHLPLKNALIFLPLPFGPYPVHHSEKLKEKKQAAPLALPALLSILIA